jgi:hypothetical protein
VCGHPGLGQLEPHGDRAEQNLEEDEPDGQAGQTDHLAIATAPRPDDDSGAGDERHAQGRGQSVRVLDQRARLKRRN